MQGLAPFHYFPFFRSLSQTTMLDALINGLAGVGGGIMAQLITCPLLTVNTCQRTQRVLKKKKRKLGIIEQMCQVVKQEG